MLTMFDSGTSTPSMVRVRLSLTACGREYSCLSALLVPKDDSQEVSFSVKRS